MGKTEIPASAPASRPAERDPQVFLKSILDGIRDYAVAALDPDGTIRTWNGGAERLYGYAAPDAIGRGIAILWPQETLTAVPFSVIADTARRAGGWDAEIDHSRRDGTRF